ncbi:hypothetical protein ABZV93_08740 [Actinopolymorpha sp. NPDC004070]|uniref:hypothetical protein n=1 Tax=Actinopolymorpha sp. NPDC004070 TaxID=3154548 RepID=UPI0033B0196C
MQRGSDRHSPRVDDDLKADAKAMETANRATRAHEWREPEPGAPEPGKDLPLVAGHAEDAEGAAEETGEQSPPGTYAEADAEVTDDDLRDAAGRADRPPSRT